MKKIYLLLLVILGMNFQAFSQITEKHFRIYSTKTNQEISLDKIVADFKNYDVILYGEEHNDSVTHFLQNKLFELLFDEYGSKLTLSLEMFDRDVQTVMNEYLQGYIREKNFVKDARAWNNYKDYRPMVEFAKKNNLYVVCANASGRYTNLVGRKGQEALMALPKESKKYFAPLPYEKASGGYLQKLENLTSHSAPATTDTSIKKMPVMSMGDFDLIMAQSLWDATMAYSIASYLKKNKGKKVLQLNGRFHSDEGFAIATQLKKYNSKIKTLIISTGADYLFPNLDWNKFKHLGDYIIITNPGVPKTF